MTGPRRPAVSVSVQIPFEPDRQMKAVDFEVLPGGVLSVTEVVEPGGAPSAALDQSRHVLHYFAAGHWLSLRVER